MGGWIAAELAARGRARTVVATSPAGMYTTKELDYASRILRFSFAAAQRLAPHAERITATAAGRRLAFGITYAHPERLDPGDAAYALKVFAGSPSFLRTLNWIEDRAEMPRGLHSIDCPVPGRLGHARPAAAGAPGTAMGGAHDAARRWSRCPGLGHVPMGDDPAADGREDPRGHGAYRRSGASGRCGLSFERALRRRRERGGHDHHDEGAAWMTMPSASPGIGSPNTTNPPVMAETLAAALVSVMTGTASPCWRPRAEA